MTTTLLTNDILTNGDTGFTIAGVGDKLIVDTGVSVFSESDQGVLSNVSATLVNRGSIIATTNFGVEFNGGGQITNAATGFIFGTAGLGVHSLGATITNWGSVTGFLYYGVSLATNANLINHGGIRGVDQGIAIVSSLGTGATVDNFGRISSDGTGIYLNKDPLDLGTIFNRVGGIIQGDEFAITGFSGKLTVTNFGTIAGIVRSVAAGTHDVVTNHGLIQGQVRLGPGNDKFDGTTGRSGAVLGEAGNDQLLGGPHGDILIGANGKDALTGRAGADQFRFLAVSDSVTGANRDVITDFHHAEHDHIVLSAIDANAGTLGNEAFVFIGGDSFAHFHSVHPGVIGMVRFAGGIVQGNVNAALGADFEIKVPGPAHLVAGDFVL